MSCPLFTFRARARTKGLSRASRARVLFSLGAHYGLGALWRASFSFSPNVTGKVGRVWRRSNGCHPRHDAA